MQGQSERGVPLSAKESSYQLRDLNYLLCRERSQLESRTGWASCTTSLESCDTSELSSRPRMQWMEFRWFRRAWKKSFQDKKPAWLCSVQEIVSEIEKGEEKFVAAFNGEAWEQLWKIVLNSVKVIYSGYRKLQKIDVWMYSSIVHVRDLQ